MKVPPNEVFYVSDRYSAALEFFLRKKQKPKRNRRGKCRCNNRNKGTIMC